MYYINCHFYLFSSKCHLCALESGFYLCVAHHISYHGDMYYKKTVTVFKFYQQFFFKRKKLVEQWCLNTNIWIAMITTYTRTASTNICPCLWWYRPPQHHICVPSSLPPLICNNKLVSVASACALCFIIPVLAIHGFRDSFIVFVLCCLVYY